MLQTDVHFPYSPIKSKALIHQHNIIHRTEAVEKIVHSFDEIKDIHKDEVDRAEERRNKKKTARMSF